jgi:hypothetical protein
MSTQCDSCRETVPGFDTIHYGSMEAGYRDLCSRCFNQEVAELGGLNFEHVAFEPAMRSGGEPSDTRFPRFAPWPRFC